MTDSIDARLAGIAAHKQMFLEKASVQQKVSTKERIFEIISFLAFSYLSRSPNGSDFSGVVTSISIGENRW
jgi:hypothetical protein